MAEDYSDLGTLASNRGLPNSDDHSDIGQRALPEPVTQSWKTAPIKPEQIDQSDIGYKLPAPKSYSVDGGNIHFSVDRPYDGMEQAISDGLLDPSFAAKNSDQLRDAQVRRQDVISAAGDAAVAKALLHGGGRGAAFLAGAIPGGKVGTAIGVGVVGGPEDPLAAITGPIGGVIGSLTTGTIASMAYSKAMDKAADYNLAVRSLVASGELHPVMDASGELVAFAASAPKSIANLVKLGEVAKGAGGSPAIAISKQLARGAAGGAIFEGVVRPAFDYGRYYAADQLGIQHDKFQGPGLTSLAQNVGLGLLAAGHNLQFKDYNGAEVANIVLRAKAREAANIPLGADDAAGVIGGFEKLGADPNADLQKNGLLVPLNNDEISIYATIKDQMDQMRESGVLDEKQVASLKATQATAPGLFGKNAPITSAVIGLKEKEKPNATNPEQQQTGVPTQRIGTDEVGTTGTEGGAGNRVPSEASKQSKAVATDPEAIAKEIGWFFNPTPNAGGMRLEGIPPEKLAQMQKTWEFTYRGNGPLQGMTFYVPEGATPDQIKARANDMQSKVAAVDPQAPPVPETPETVNEQVKMLVDGKRSAILLTPGEQEPALPAGFKRQSTRAGVFFYDPKVWDGGRIQSYVATDQIGDILNYGIPAKPAPGTEVGAVVVRSPEGVEKQGVLTDKEHLPAVTAAAEKVASPGDKIAIESEAEVIQKRTSAGSLRTRKPKATAEKAAPTMPEIPNTPMDQRDPEWQRTADWVGVPYDQWVIMANYNDYDQNKLWGTTRAKLMEKAALGQPSAPAPSTEKETKPNEPESRQDVVVNPGKSSGTVATETGGAASKESVGAISQPGGGTNVGIPSEDEGRQQPTDGNGDRRAEPVGSVSEQPGSGSGQPATSVEPLRASPEPVQVPTRSFPEKPVTDDPNAQNHVIKAEDTIAPAGRVGKLKANIEAIMLLKRLDSSNRNATADEKRILAQYTGWGGLSQAFDSAKGEKMTREDYYGRDDKWEKQWGKYYQTLQNLLSEDEWAAAARSSQFAHYTSRTVIDKMWEAAQRMGFIGGNVLEPAAGVGHFFGLAPESVRDSSRFVGVERDSLSGRILSKLYPQAKTFVKGYEEVTLPPNSIDLAITNVPFSPRLVDDKNYPKLNVHNYFIARMIDSVKPGGLVVTITTSHTMDSQSVMRQFLAAKGELIGAIRLPNDAFKENAGTEVTTDILFLRKPMTPTPTAGQSWASMKATVTHDGKPLSINEYFVDHPAMVLGKLSLEGSMHGGEDEFTLQPFEGQDLGKLLQEAIGHLPENIFGRSPSQMIDFGALGLAEGLKDNTMTLRDGTLAVARAGQFVDPITVDELFKRPEIIEQGKAYIGLRDTYKGLLAGQISPDTTEAQLANQRDQLNKLYDGYVKKYGFLNSKKNDFLEFEQSYYLLMGLEKEQIVKGTSGRPTKTYIKMDVFSKRTQFPRIPPSSSDTFEDAVKISLSYQGRVDPEFIGTLMGVEAEKAEDELLARALAFRNPENGLLESPERYLSGNVRRKLARAKDAADGDDKFKSNVEALLKVQPADVPFRQIRSRIGSTWLPDSVMSDFAREVFGSTRGSISYVEAVDRWIVGGFLQTPQVKQTYATRRYDGEELLGYALNQKSPTVYDTVPDGNGGERRVFNQKETTKAAAVIDKLQSAFQQWLRKKADVQTIVEQRYNESFNCFVLPSYEIDRLDLPGASEQIILRSNQRRAVWRMIQEGHGVLAHTVGSGKTFEMIATAMEMKRLGLAKKPMIAVKNSTLGQFAIAFRTMYPGANILIASRDDLAKEKRKLFLSRIASGDYDAIIIPHSQFDMLEDDPEFEKQQVKGMLEELEDAIRLARAKAGESSGKHSKDVTVKELERQKEKFEDRLKSLSERKLENIITFQQLGIDQLFVDEIHEYKKPPFITKLDRVAGLERQTSKRAYSLLMKARWLQSRNNGRGVIGATGTPVTNTLGEAWHMLNITSPHVLKEYNVDTFDRFVSVFALINQSFDVNAVGNLVLKAKLSTFVNGPELLRMIGASWDVLGQDQLRRILEGQGEAYPRLAGGKVQSVVVPKTDSVKEFNKYLLDIYTSYKNLTGQDKKTYSYIPVLTFLAGKAAALDIRMVRRNAPDDPGSKVNTAVKNIYEIWKETAANRLTQAVFVDSFNHFTDGIATLNAFAAGQDVQIASDQEADRPDNVVLSEDLFIYQDIKRKLVALGVPANEILIVNEHDVNKPEASLLFDRVNSGEIRIALGSTAKMGVGVNMQKKMYALHHIDTPWFPALLEQRNGRIERPGNTNPEVRIMYYGMEGTIDAGLYAKNEAKAKFAHQILSGSVTAREFEDPVGPMIATLQEQMASLSGDPLLIEKVQLESRIRTLTLEKESFEDDMGQKQSSARGLESSAKSLASSIVRDSATLDKVEPLVAGEGFSAIIAGREYKERKDVIEAMQAVVRIQEAKIRKRIADKFYDTTRNGVFILSTANDDLIPLGTINGIAVEIHMAAEKSVTQNDKGEKVLTNDVKVSGMKASILVAGKEERLPIGYPSTAEGLLRAIKEIPNHLKYQVENANKQIVAAQNEIAEIQILLQRTFPQEKELADALQRYTALQEEVINGEQGQRAADLLFDMGIDPIPLLIRLHNAVNSTSSELENQINLHDRAVSRHGLLLRNSNATADQVDAAKKEAEARDEAIVSLRERLDDLTRRLGVVEKARMESEVSGEASRLGYGLTPSNRPGISYDPTFSSPTVGDELKAEGVEAIRGIVFNPLNGMSEDARKVALNLLDQPVMKGLQWDKLAVALVNNIQGNFSGTADLSNWLIEIAKQSNPKTFPHEVFHFLYAMLPDADKVRIDDLRRDAVLKQYGEHADERLVQGTISSEQAIAAGVDPRDYHLINPSEFLAHFASQKFAEESLRDDPIFESLWSKIVRWLRGLLDSIKRALGFKPSMEQIVSDILAGKNVSSIDTLQEFEKGTQGELVDQPEPEPLESDGTTIADLEAEITQAEANALKEGHITTEVLGRIDTILGREKLTAADLAAGEQYAHSMFEEAGLQVEKDEAGLWKLVDPAFSSEIEGRKLLDILIREIASQNSQPEPDKKTGYLGHLLNSVVVNMTVSTTTAFSPQLRNDLYAVAQGERSHRGIMLAVLAGFGKTVNYVARNVDVILNRIYSDSFGGDAIRDLMTRILTNFRDYFTDEEVEKTLTDHKEADKAIRKIIALNRQDEGGRVYRKAQSLLKPKNKKKIAQLESDARVKEAVDYILQQLKKEGIEPKPSPNKPLPPLERLLLMVHPKTADKINEAIQNAVKDAERNAGIKAAISAAVDDDEREDLRARFDAGEEPDKNMIETGLLLPQFSHWKALRDTLLDYSPTTLKLAHDLIRGNFKGTVGKAKLRVADMRIDLRELATKPEAEIEKVINSYLQNLDANMDLRSATPDTKQRILTMVEKELTTQIEAARNRYVNSQFKEPAVSTTPATPEEQLRKLFNAGLLADPRLDVLEMVQRVADRTGIKRLMPTMTEMVNQVLEAPFYNQTDLQKNFVAQLIAKLGVSDEDAEAAGRIFHAAFSAKFAEAQKNALKKASESLTPKERKPLNRQKGTWRKLEQAVNAGIFDPGHVLETIAAGHGWNVPDDAMKARMRNLGAQIQKLRELTPAELQAVGTNPVDIARATREKESATLERRIALKREFEGLWARVTQPFALMNKTGRQNIMRAIAEFTPANLLFKIGFAPRLAIDILTQGATHAPTRAIQEAFERWGNDRSAGRDASLWRDIAGAINDSRKAWTSTITANLAQSKEALAGRGEARNVDRLSSQVAFFQRNAIGFEEALAERNYPKAAITALIHGIGFSFRVAQMLDAFQGLPAEWMEIRNQVITALRENGMSRAEASTKADDVIGDFRNEWKLAISRAREVLEGNGVKPKASQIKSAAVQIVKANAYARIREMGLLPDDFEEHNRILRNTLSWGEREEGGIGGAIAGGMRWTGRVGEKIGFPLGIPFVTLTRFSNAIGTGINYKLMHTPMGFFPGLFEGSPWARTERDRAQMQVRAAIGSLFGLTVFLLAYYGLLKYQSRPPMGKAERDLWEREGHRSNTIEIQLGDGSFIPISTIIGPLAMVSPYIAAGAKLNELTLRKANEQKKLNEEAAKLGVAPGTVSPLGAADYLSVAAEAAWNALLGSRTAAGLSSTVTEYGTPNLAKTVSGVLSPIVPGLPGYQEASRLAGVTLDPKLASVFDFMVPLPTSSAAKSNLLGDNVGTDDALQRVVQILTGGTYGPVDPALAHQGVGYQSLYASGYRPPAIDVGKNYLVNGEFRPLTPAELANYTDARGQFLKEELSALGYTDDPKAVRQAYLRANQRALEKTGASTLSASSSASSAAQAAPELPTLPSVASSRTARPSAGSAVGRRAGSLRRRGSFRRASFSGPSLRRAKSSFGHSRSRSSGSLRRRRT